MIDVAVIDDHAIFRRGVDALLSEQSDMRLCATCASVSEAATHFEAHRCHVVLLDIDMPGQRGLDALPELCARYDWLRVVLVSFHPEQQYAARALRQGARGYVCKADADQQLVTAIRAVVGGRTFVTPEMATQLNTSRRTAMRPHEQLSDREFQVMTLLVKGHSNSEISAALNLSPKTVSTYRARIFEKLHVDTNAALVRYAIENHLA